MMFKYQQIPEINPDLMFLSRGKCLILHNTTLHINQLTHIISSFSMDIKSVIKTFAEAWAAASLRLDKSSGQGPGVTMPPMSPISQIPGLQSLRSLSSSPADRGKEFIFGFILFNIYFLRMVNIQPNENRII